MNQLRRIVNACAVAGLLASAATARAGDSVVLKPKFTSGVKQFVEIDQQSTQKMSGPMGNMEFKMQNLYLVERQVKAVKDGAADLVLRFERALSSFDSPMMEGMFDTDDPDNEDAASQVGAVLKPMIGMSFNMKINADGEIAKVSGMTEIREKVEEGGAGSPMTGQMASRLTDERAKQEWGDSMFALYPNKEVKPGDTWKKTIHDSIPRMGPVVFSYDCKLDRLSEEQGRKVAIVTYSGKVENDKSAKSDEAGHGTLAGTFTGTATFDIDQGQFVRREQAGKTNVTMSGPPGGGRGRGADDKDDEDEAKSNKKDDDEAGESAPQMKIDIDQKQTIRVMSDRELKDKRAEEAKKRAAAKKADKDNDEDDDD